MAEYNISGRAEEKAQLHSILNSEAPAFLAVYGRRRVGKTFLIKEFFADKGTYFHLTGVQNANLNTQLLNFSIEFADCFGDPDEINAPPKKWILALTQLRKKLEQLPDNEKKILFFDELPWLAAKRSGFLSALEHAWNRYFSNMPNLIIIVCGSAASWIIDNVINNKGGLHNRITHHIPLKPFTLKETEQYLHQKNIHLDQKQIIELYMAFGGVAKYLSYVNRGQSVEQIIAETCFGENGHLADEFNRLYQSLFSNSEVHTAIVKTLANCRFGLSYKQIVEKTGFSSGGVLSKKLDELTASSFITRMPIYKKGVREIRYVLVDEFSLFHLKWLQNKADKKQLNHLHHWQQQKRSHAWASWAGFAFEMICYKHLHCIIKALGISGISVEISKWYDFSKTNGSEIDLIIDRPDHCINLCEIKFTNEPYTISKDYMKKLEHKKMQFKEKTKTNKTIFLTMISPYGVKQNSHYLATVDSQLDMAMFF